MAAPPISLFAMKMPGPRLSKSRRGVKKNGRMKGLSLAKLAPRHRHFVPPLPKLFFMVATGCKTQRQMSAGPHRSRAGNTPSVFDVP